MSYHEVGLLRETQVRSCYNRTGQFVQKLSISKLSSLGPASRRKKLPKSHVNAGSLSLPILFIKCPGYWPGACFLDEMHGRLSGASIHQKTGPLDKTLFIDSVLW